MGPRCTAGTIAFSAWIVIGTSGWFQDAASEENSRRRPYWVHLGAGLGGGENAGGIALGAGFCREALRGIVGIRTFAVAIPSQMHPCEGETTTQYDREFKGGADIGLLYGQQLAVGRWGYVAALAGVGWASAGTEKTVDEGALVVRSTTFSTWSIPMELQCFFTPVIPLDLGFIISYDLNPDASFGGVLLCLQLR